jgi:hypothetical protein
MLTINLESYRVPKIFLRLCLDGVAGIRSLLQCKPKETLAIIRAHFGFYKRLPSAIRKRSLQEKRINRSPNLKPPFYKNLIIIERFLKGRRHYSDLNHDG